MQICGRKLNKISPGAPPPGSMLPFPLSIWLSFSVPLCPGKTFMLLKMKLEPKGSREQLWPKMTLKKGGNWWQHQVFPAGVRTPKISRQKVGRKAELSHWVPPRDTQCRADPRGDPDSPPDSLTTSSPSGGLTAPPTPSSYPCNAQALPQF